MMRTYLIAALLTALAANSAFGQSQPRVTGRLLGPDGAPLAGKTVAFRKGETELHPVTTDATGGFSFFASVLVPYRVSLGQDADIGTVEIAEARDLDLGDLVPEVTATGKQWVRFAGTTHLARGSRAPSKLIAAFYVSCPAPPEKTYEECAGGEMHLIHGDGSQYQSTAQPGEVGISHPAISEDKTAVGWLVDFDNCCTSYSLSLPLVVYMPGKPPRTYKGDGRAIFGWHFVAGGKQVAFYQSFPHGNPVAHFELREVATGRLVSKWDDGDAGRRPLWTKGLD